MTELVTSLNELTTLVRTEDEALATVQRGLEDKRRELAAAQTELKTLTDVVRDKGIDPDVPLAEYIAAVQRGVEDTRRYRQEAEDYMSGRKKPEEVAPAKGKKAASPAAMSPAPAVPQGAEPAHDELFGGGIA